MRSTLFLIALGVAAAGCGHSQDAAAGPTSQPQDSATESPEENATDESAGADDEAARAELRATMHTYLWRFVDARDLLVAGELESARSSLASLVEEEPPAELPGDWSGAIDAVRLVADSGANAENAAGLAASIGQTALLCGGCHTGTEGGPGLTFAEPPDLSDTLEGEMHRHVWASDRLWEGLVAPSDDRWAAGVRAVFADSALNGPTATGPSDIEWALTMTQEELVAADGRTRSEFYADFVAACASCHGQMGFGPAQ